MPTILSPGIRTGRLLRSRHLNLEKSLQKIGSVDSRPRDLEGTYRRLRSLVMHPAELRRMSAAAPGFVARHNEASVVADRFISFWENKEV